MLGPDFKFVTAHFTDDERLTVQSYWSNEVTGEYVEDVIEVKEDDPSYKNLLNYTTIDDLHENNYRNIKASDEAIKEQVIDIAKDR